MSESTIRWLRQSDLEQIVEIEEQTFPHPWDMQDFEICLRKKNAFGVVQILDEKVIGYMIFQCTSKSYNILSIAVDPKHQKCGNGRKMIEYVKNKIRASTEGPKNQIILIVSDQNLVCHKFLKSLDFVATKINKDYFGPDHDAYHFVMDMRDQKKIKVKKKGRTGKVKDVDKME
jgi:ribosomal-protein-alanine N-acetyltransferase